MEAGKRRHERLLLTAVWLIALMTGCAGADRGGDSALELSPAAGQARVQFSIAEGYFYKELYQEAVREYSLLIAAVPEHAAAYRCRAAALAALQQDGEALADYRRALELAPGDDDTWLGRGLFYFARGRFAEAVEDFDRAIALDPGNAVSHLFKARACDRIGKFREADAARRAYIHCTVPRGKETVGERPPVRELRALGLE